MTAQYDPLSEEKLRTIASSLRAVLQLRSTVTPNDEIEKETRELTERLWHLAIEHQASVKGGLETIYKNLTFDKCTDYEAIRDTAQALYEKLDQASLFLSLDFAIDQQDIDLLKYKSRDVAIEIDRLLCKSPTKSGPKKKFLLESYLEKIALVYKEATRLDFKHIRSLPILKRREYSGYLRTILESMYFDGSAFQSADAMTRYSERFLEKYEPIPDE